MADKNSYYPFYVLRQHGSINWRGHSEADHIDGDHTIDEAREDARLLYENGGRDISQVLILKTVEVCPIKEWEEEAERAEYEALKKKYEKSDGKPIELSFVDPEVLKMHDDELETEIAFIGQGIECSCLNSEHDRTAHYVRKLIALLNEVRGKPITDVGSYKGDD